MINWDSLLKTSRASKYSYKSINQLIKFEKKSNFVKKSNGYNLKIISATESNTQLYTWIDIYDKTLYIAYKGTDTIQDMVSNVDIRLYKYHNDIEIHRGFWYKYKSIQSLLLKHIDIIENIQDINKIICTGHSLGAALASITAFDLSQLGYNTILHTFGSPRIGNEDFAYWSSKYISHHYRISHIYDIVPSLPFSDPYRHIIGNGIIFDQNKNFTISHIDENKNNNYTTKLTLKQLHFYHGCTIYIHNIKHQIAKYRQQI